MDKTSGTVNSVHNSLMRSAPETLAYLVRVACKPSDECQVSGPDTKSTVIGIISFNHKEWTLLTRFCTGVGKSSFLTV